MIVFRIITFNVVPSFMHTYIHACALSIYYASFSMVKNIATACGKCFVQIAIGDAQNQRALPNPSNFLFLVDTVLKHCNLSLNGSILYIYIIYGAILIDYSSWYILANNCVSNLTKFIYSQIHHYLALCMESMKLWHLLVPLYQFLGSVKPGDEYLAEDWWGTTLYKKILRVSMDQPSPFTFFKRLVYFLE